MADGFTSLSKADANHDADGYLLDANGQRATVGNQAAVLAAIAASRPAAAYGGTTAADEANTAFDARQVEEKRLVEEDRLRNLNPQQRLQEAQVRAGRDEQLQHDQFDFARHESAVRDQFAQHDSDLRDATTFAELAAKKLAYQNDISTQLDTGHFLTKASGLDTTSPDYEKKLGGFLALHPNASGPAVQDFISTNHAKRQLFLAANQAGGAAEFAPGPAQDAYNTHFEKSHDPAEARAVAGNVVKGEEEIQKAREDGLLLPEHVDPESKNSFVNKDGTVDYKKAARILGARRGEVDGLEQKQTRKQVDEARQIIAVYSDITKRAQGGPKAQALYDDAVDFVLQQRLKDKAKAAGQTGAPVAPLPPAGAAALTRF